MAASRDDLKGQVVTVVGYGLYADGVRVTSFAEGRISYRLWATRTDRINPSLEDRLDHDVDELMA